MDFEDDDLFDDDPLRIARDIAELRRLLAGGGLAPDTRARSLAALIEADAMLRADGLTEALKGFTESAEELAASLRQRRNL